jgi:hypothetical protein
MTTAANCPSCSVRKLIEETENIDKLAYQIDYLNARVLHSFKVRLVMDDPVDGDADAHTQAQAQAQGGNLI